MRNNNKETIVMEFSEIEFILCKNNDQTPCFHIVYICLGLLKITTTFLIV